MASGDDFAGLDGKDGRACGSKKWLNDVFVLSSRLYMNWAAKRRGDICKRTETVVERSCVCETEKKGKERRRNGEKERARKGMIGKRKREKGKREREKGRKAPYRKTSRPKDTQTEDRARKSSLLNPPDDGDSGLSSREYAMSSSSSSA